MRTMTPRARWLALLAVIVVLAGGVALTRPGPPAGRVLYLRLRLAPYVGSYKEVQTWIDAANGRVRYAEAMPPGGNVATTAGGQQMLPPATMWYVITLRQQSDGRCAVVYTTLLDGSERGDPFACAGLLALRDVAGLQARARALRQRYGAHARVSGSAILVPVPVGTDLVTPVMDHYNMRYGYETMVPGVLALDRSSGRPLSISGYHRERVTMTGSILEARDLPPGSLPGGFFDAPPFSLPDRAPRLYHWLRQILPWHP